MTHQMASSDLLLVSEEFGPEGLAEVTRVLFEEAKLPTDPTLIIGKTFCFVCTDKDWGGTVIIGSIVGLINDGQRIDIYISVPDIDDIPISRLSYNRGYRLWYIRVDPKSIGGELVLFV